MVFEYTRSGSITVKVDGGIVELKNIRVLNHPEAKISFSDNLLTVSGLMSEVTHYALPLLLMKITMQLMAICLLLLIRQLLLLRLLLLLLL